MIGDHLGMPVPWEPWLSSTPLPAATEACCELCGLYFENRKALASHARAHLRQFGVTEWCVNGSPIETLSEWIKHRPQKVGAYRSYIQGGRPFTKKFRSAGHGRDSDRRPPLGLAPGGLSFVGRSAGGEPGPEAGRAADGGERPLAASPPGTVKAEEHQRQNINSECQSMEEGLQGGHHLATHHWTPARIFFPSCSPFCPSHSSRWLPVISCPSSQVPTASALAC